MQLLHVGRAEDDQDKGSVSHEEQSGDGEDQIRKVKDSDRQVLKCTISPGKEPKIIGSVCRVQMIEATVFLKKKPGGDLMTKEWATWRQRVQSRGLAVMTRLVGATRIPCTHISFLSSFKFLFKTRMRSFKKTLGFVS